MGADLIGTGFTVRSDRKCSLDAIAKAIDTIPNERLTDEEFLNALDPSEMIFDTSDPEYVRETLKTGAQEFESAGLGHRMSIAYPIQGTALTFVWTGGMSWGDDPFEGFTELCIFTNLCSMVDDVREAAAFVCNGLPGAALVAMYA